MPYPVDSERHIDPDVLWDRQKLAEARLTQAREVYQNYPGPQAEIRLVEAERAVERAKRDRRWTLAHDSQKAERRTGADQES